MIQEGIMRRFRKGFQMQQEKNLKYAKNMLYKTLKTSGITERVKTSHDIHSKNIFLCETIALIAS